MKHDVKLRGTFAVIGLILYSLNVIAETIPSSQVRNCKIDAAWTLSGHPEIMEKTWQGVCRAIDLPPTDVQGGWWCVNHSGNPIYIQSGDVCADGSFKIPMNFGWCNEPVVSCPNSSWTLSEDKKTCFRRDDACWKDIENISELKLLAAIAYGESSVNDVYEEMAGVTSATIRRRDAARFQSVNDLIQNFQNYSNVVHDGNKRFKKLMCADNENEFKIAYDAARNALAYGKDYAEGGCFWDGYDLKVSGTHHPTYRKGFQFTDPKHNVFLIDESPPVARKSRGKIYHYTFDSTSAQGQTVFWKLNSDFLKAKGARQCI